MNMRIFKAVSLFSAILLLFAGIFLDVSETTEFIIFFIAYLLIGYDVILAALGNLFKGEFFDEYMLMTIATAGAFFIGEYLEASAVMIFYKIGEHFSELSFDNSKKSIKELMDIRPDTANVKRDGEIVALKTEEINIGEVVIVKAGERIPLDGLTLKGSSDIDMSPLNGESVPKAVAAGDMVLSGAINLSGVLEVEVTKKYGESTADKIIELVENAASKKSKTERFITRFSKVYTPVVVASAFIIGVVIPLAFGLDMREWIYKGLVFLIVSCPCALVLSVPLSFFSGIGRASKSGILIKGGNYFEALGNVRTAVFDKTGTLTKGSFEISEIRTNGISEEELIKTAVYAEYYSNHPLAAAVKSQFAEIDESIISDYSETPGEGISVSIGGKAVLAGNSRLLKRYGINPPVMNETLIYIAIGGKYAGAVIFDDQIKEGGRNLVSELKKKGVKKIVMLTGDNLKKAETTAKKLGITEFYAELLPQDKLEKVEALKKELAKNETLLFVGDGINDAPVLAAADIGIAMGGIGSDSAIEAADAVIMDDEPQKAAMAISIARKTKAKARQNIVLAIGIKFAVQLLSVFGMTDMWVAVCADVGVTLLAVLNAMRLMRIKSL